MPTKHDEAFSKKLTDTAMGCDALCEDLAQVADSRAEPIIALLRDVEFECNELAEQVSHD